MNLLVLATSFPRFYLENRKREEKDDKRGKVPEAGYVCRDLLVGKPVLRVSA
jgi:hypothetical protein